MRAFCAGFLLLVAATPCLAQRKPAAAVKVKIEASEWDKRLLLEKLQNHGKDQGLQFESADSDFEYRVVFETGQHQQLWGIWGSGGSINASSAQTAVYDSKGVELFRFGRSGRATDKGAANAAAKEIIKRLLQFRHQQTAQESKKL